MMCVGGKMIWEREGKTWPHRECSRFVTVGGFHWHVQSMGPTAGGDGKGGDAPLLLLVHGTAATTHSWRDLMAPLARSFRVVAIDLPGHGFTRAPFSFRPTLPSMAKALSGLLAAEGLRPDGVIGHSAGAAILARMVLDGSVTPRMLVSINGAFMPFPGMAGTLFPYMARVLFCNPLTPYMMSWGAADQQRVERLIRDTGSRLDKPGMTYYGRLMRSPAHVSSALSMMAHWDLTPLNRDLQRLTIPLHLIVGEEDKAVSPDEAKRLATRVATATLHVVPGGGHLVHEEQPDLVVGLIEQAAREVALLPPLS
ncbi:alpha/beta hydrolase [Rhodospirillum rubrum]|nr:alpha/beta hydrolase [Rhodospirillum rubrum]MBK1676890.1 alpha/beta hydrolase [Rhodospirillum rubrum]